MNFYKNISIWLVSIALFFSLNVSATNSTHLYENWGFGIHFGGTSFFGDLADYSGGLNNTPFSKYFYKDMRSMGGITLEKWFGPYFAARGFMGYGSLQGTKDKSSAWFEAHIFEYHLEAMVDLTNLIFGVDRRRIVSLYGFVGIGFTESRTWKYNSETGDLIGTNGFGKPRKDGGSYIPMTETVVPVGMIVNVFVANKVSFFFEGSFHPINTDKLDATPNENSSYIAGLEGYNYFSLGMNIWFGAGGKGHHRRGRGGARYTSRRGTSVNPRVFRRNTRAIFKRGKSRFRFKRK
jgi:hypothetical protein